MVNSLSLRLSTFLSVLEQVRQGIIRNPKKSVRKSANSTGIRKSSVHVIMKKKEKKFYYGLFAPLASIPMG